MSEKKVVNIHERIPSIKDQRKQRANRRLLFFLSFFFLLLLLIIYFQSPLSNIKSITVVNNYFISDEEVIEVSGLDYKMNIWSIDKKEIRERLESHYEINTVEIERIFPNKIEIIVEEYSRIAYLYRNEHYYPILETGHSLNEIPKDKLPADAPVLIDFNVEDEDTLAELAKELSELPSQMIERISEVFYTPTDVDPLAVQLYMTDGFEVHTTIAGFSEKMAPYPSIIKELDPNEEGILHMRMSPYFEQLHIEEEDELEGEG